MGIASVLIVAVTVLVPTQARPGGRIAGGWEGLINKQVVKLLQDHKTTKVADVSFAYGVIRDQKTFDAIDKVAAAQPYRSTHSWPRWASTLDWNQEVVVCVIRTAPTNSLKLGSLRLSRDGLAKLGLRFSAIEPSYGDHYPVVMYRFKLERQTKVVITIDMDEDNKKAMNLATVDLQRRKPAGRNEKSE